MNEIDKFNEEMHGKGEEEKAQRIYGGNWRPEHSAITRPEPHTTYAATDAAFESEVPYKLAPADFTDEKEKRIDAIAKAVIKVDWKQILEKK